MKLYTCDEADKKIFKDTNGILQSLDYPNYTFGKEDCRFTLTPPEGYGFVFYILDLSISNEKIGDD